MKTLHDNYTAAFFYELDLNKHDPTFYALLKYVSFFLSNHLLLVFNLNFLFILGFFIITQIKRTTG